MQKNIKIKMFDKNVHKLQKYYWRENSNARKKLNDVKMFEKIGAKIQMQDKN